MYPPFIPPLLSPNTPNSFLATYGNAACPTQWDGRFLFAPQFVGISFALDAHTKKSRNLR